MSDNAAASPDRLPWLADEPKSSRTGAIAILLSGAVSIAVLGVALSYSPWPIRISAADNNKPSVTAKSQVPNARPREKNVEVYGNLQIDPGPPPETGATLVAMAPIEPAPLPMPAAIPPARKVSAEKRSAPAPVAAGSKPAASKSAGMDCSAAKSRAAIAVCGNGGLATLDREHALLYKQSWRLANPEKRALLMGARQRMTGNLNNCQTDDCASSIYLAAMRELNATRSTKAAGSSGVIAKPGFSCRSAKKPGQIAVCRDPELAELDRHQALLYNQSWGWADAEKRARLLRSRDRLIARRDACVTERCAKSVYLAAMSEVTKIMTKQ